MYVYIASIQNCALPFQGTLQGIYSDFTKFMRVHSYGMGGDLLTSDQNKFGSPL